MGKGAACKTVKKSISHSLSGCWLTRFNLGNKLLRWLSLYRVNAVSYHKCI